MMRLYIVMSRYKSLVWSPSYSGARRAPGWEDSVMDCSGGHSSPASLTWSFPILVLARCSPQSGEVGSPVGWLPSPVVTPRQVVILFVILWYLTLLIFNITEPPKIEIEVRSFTTNMSFRLYLQVCKRNDLTELILQDVTVKACPLTAERPCEEQFSNSSTFEISSLEPTSCYNFTFSPSLLWNISSPEPRRAQFCTGESLV